MSLNRTALRMATVLCLTNGFQEPYPTIAKGRVHDSRIEPLQSTDPQDLVPNVVVYTDNDNGHGLSTNNGGPPFRRIVDLSMWLTIGMIGEDTEAGGQVYMLPQTDAELDAMLDLFEHQVRFALTDISNPWCVLMAPLFTRIINWKSDRVVAEGNIRLSARQVTAEVEITDDLMPIVVYQDPPPGGLPEGLQALLDAVGTDVPGYVKTTIELLRAGRAPTTITMPKLNSIWFKETTPAGSPAPVWNTPDLNPDP